jgi:hypothetical protein
VASAHGHNRVAPCLAAVAGTPHALEWYFSRSMACTKSQNCRWAAPAPACAAIPPPARRRTTGDRETQLFQRSHDRSSNIYLWAHAHIKHSPHAADIQDRDGGIPPPWGYWGLVKACCAGRASRIALRSSGYGSVASTLPLNQAAILEPQLIHYLPGQTLRGRWQALLAMRSLSSADIERLKIQH